MNNYSDTRNVTIKHVWETHVECCHATNPKEHFPGAKVGQVWRVTTGFSAFYRGIVVKEAVLIKGVK